MTIVLCAIAASIGSFIGWKIHAWYISEVHDGLIEQIEDLEEELAIANINNESVCQSL